MGVCLATGGGKKPDFMLACESHISIVDRLRGLLYGVAPIFFIKGLSLSSASSPPSLTASGRNGGMLYSCKPALYY